MAVSGQVKLVGEPLKDGAIQFVPLEKTNQDTQGGAPIADGAYTIPRKDGLKPGKYLIRITSGDGKTAAFGSRVTPGGKSSEEAGGPGGALNIVSVDQIPDEWNAASQKQVDVKSDGPNKFDFDIPNRNPYLKKRR
jgi:hypothetical protein